MAAFLEEIKRGTLYNNLIAADIGDDDDEGAIQALVVGFKDAVAFESASRFCATGLLHQDDLASILQVYLYFGIATQSLMQSTDRWHLSPHNLATCAVPLACIWGRHKFDERCFQADKLRVLTDAQASHANDVFYAHRSERYFGETMASLEH